MEKEKKGSESLKDNKNLEDLKDQARRARSKKLIVFDLDGTLAESKAMIDNEMASLLNDLLKHKLVAVIGGGAFSQFKNQFLANLHLDAKCLTNLFLFPTSGSSFYRCEKGIWIQKYEYKLSPQEQEKIIAAFKEAFQKIGYMQPAKIWGKIIENRGTQITFSALGQNAPIEEKEKWNKTKDHLRKELMVELKKILPEFEIRSGGLTSIDITKKGIDKAFGIQEIIKTLKVTKDDMIFVGDALYEGGNDYPVKTTGVETVQVSGPEDTKLFIKTLLQTDKN
jgi:HAD superfamily hydrolase (TIGR01484 family)